MGIVSLTLCSDVAKLRTAAFLRLSDINNKFAENRKTFYLAVSQTVISLGLVVISGAALERISFLTSTA